jgi:Protein of unknown function (DUF4242)
MPSDPAPPATTREMTMPRYLIEREFPEGLSIPMNDAGATACRAVIDNNAEDGVTWVHSYVTPDRRRTFCIYDGPTPEAVRHAAARNKLPISKVTEVRVLNPYFYQ